MEGGSARLSGGLLIVHLLAVEVAEVDNGERGIVALLPELLGCAAKLPLETADEVGGGGKLALVGNLFCEQIGNSFLPFPEADNDITKEQLKALP